MLASCNNHKGSKDQEGYWLPVITIEGSKDQEGCWLLVIIIKVQRIRKGTCFL